MRVKVASKVCLDIGLLSVNEDLYLERVLSNLETSQSIYDRLVEILYRVRAKNRLNEWRTTVSDDLFQVALDIPLHPNMMFLMGGTMTGRTDRTVALQVGSLKSTTIKADDYATYLGVETGLTRLMTFIQQSVEISKASPAAGIWTEELADRQAKLQESIDRMLELSPVDLLAPIGSVAKSATQFWVQADYLPAVLTFIASRVSFNDLPPEIRQAAVEAASYVDRAEQKIRDINAITGEMTEIEISDVISSWKNAARVGQVLGNDSKWFRLPQFTTGVDYNHAGVIGILREHLPQFLSLFHGVYDASRRFRPWQTVGEALTSISLVVSRLATKVPVIMSGGMTGLPTFLNELDFPWKYWALMQMNLTYIFTSEDDLVAEALATAEDITLTLMEEWAGSWATVQLPELPVDAGNLLTSEHAMAVALQADTEPNKVAYSEALIRLRDSLAILLLASYGSVIEMTDTHVRLQIDPNDAAGSLLPYSMSSKAIIYVRQ